jgi:UDP-N-acetylglucosamine 4,6-dehydratase (inverting)
MLNDKTILITGGTGSFGKAFTKSILKSYKPKKLIIYSRDEYKQFVMQKEFSQHESVLRFFIGDVRDKDRLYRAFDGVDIVIHAAALKQVPIAEYNPLEAIKTNIYGAENVIDASIDCGVEKVVALSSDKAVNPVNLYGATKLVSDKLFISGNSYVGKKKTKFCVVRYGNVAASRGSVIPFFQNLVESGKKELPITDFEMTRFWISLEEGVELVFRAIREATGGEIYVSKIPSFKIVDLAKAMCEDCILKEVGIREGEKLHEVMITPEDARNTYEYDDHFIIYPQFNWWGKSSVKPGGKLVKKGFRYSSDTNDKWLSVEDIKIKLKSLTIEY